MVDTNHPTGNQSLGDLLRQLRREKNVTIAEIAAETKIPEKTLRAMEADDHAMLPAEAFARGFYILYARTLGLDTEDVLKRYAEQNEAIAEKKGFPLPMKQGKKVNTMASRPFVAHASFLGFILVLLFAVISLICFYFSWNPASFISEKLRDMQQQDAPAVEKEEAVSGIVTSQEKQQPPVSGTLLLTAFFAEDTIATLSIDDNFPEKVTAAQGSTHSWWASRTMTIILPKDAQVSLLFNGSPLILPEPVGDFVTLNLP